MSDLVSLARSSAGYWMGDIQNVRGVLRGVLATLKQGEPLDADALRERVAEADQSLRDLFTDMFGHGFRPLESGPALVIDLDAAPLSDLGEGDAERLHSEIEAAMKSPTPTGNDERIVTPIELRAMYLADSDISDEEDED